VLHLVGRRASCFRTPASDAAELLTAYGVGEVPGTVDVGIHLRQAFSMADTFAAAACTRPPSPQMRNEEATGVVAPAAWVTVSIAAGVIGGRGASRSRPPNAENGPYVEFAFM
jgi:hypothetical protein